MEEALGHVLSEESVVFGIPRSKGTDQDGNDCGLETHVFEVWNERGIFLELVISRISEGFESVFEGARDINYVDFIALSEDLVRALILETDGLVLRHEGATVEQKSTLYPV